MVYHHSISNRIRAAYAVRNTVNMFESVNKKKFCHPLS